METATASATAAPAPTSTTASASANMFETASRLKLRFDSPKGQLSSEDLWDLPLTSQSGNRANLDSIAVALHRQVRDTAETVSFVEPAAGNAQGEILQLKFDLVRHVIRVRVAERDEARQALDRKEKKQRLLELIARKQDQELEGKSIDDLRAMVEAL